MLQRDFLIREANRYNRQLLMERIAHILASAFMLCLMLGMSVGFTAIMTTLGTEHMVLIIGLGTSIGLCLIAGIYFLFRLLDEIFYPKHSPHRITGVRK
jgi:hypothetical protein